MASPPSLGPLGRSSSWPTRIAPEVLFSLPRADARALAGLTDRSALPPAGEDTWTAWEFAWRDERGWPRCAVLQVFIAADSPKLIESKSLKLYLHGYAEQRLERTAVVANLTRDLQAALESPARIELLELDDRRLDVVTSAAVCIDAPDDESSLEPATQPSAEALAELTDIEREVFYISHTFGSLCPVTGQPDWASVSLRLTGRGPTPRALRRYLNGFRHHRGFHEACVEQIWRDVWQLGTLSALSVRAQFTRRGGIDIAPARSHKHGSLLPWCRLSRV